MSLPAPDQLLGLDASHVVEIPAEACIGAVSLHPEAMVAFLALRERAECAGIDLRAVSGYRSFERQLLIWNGKARGERTLLDERESPLDPRTLGKQDLIEAILRWSALPGASRHHWGSDVDVVDAAVLTPGQAAVLERSWFAPGAPYARLGAWLDATLGCEEAGVFFRPYRGDGGGVAEEPWHLSFAPLASHCESRLDPALLRRALATSGIELAGLIDQQLDQLLARYARVDPARYPRRWQPRPSRVLA
jgi:LAS superfamily LD-carboxypeptidase LdcB